MTGALHAGRPSGDHKRHCAGHRLHIYYIFCATCTATHWFALALEAPHEEVAGAHRRWQEQLRADCAAGKHERLEKPSRPTTG